MWLVTAISSDRSLVECQFPGTPAQAARRARALFARFYGATSFHIVSIALTEPPPL